MVHWALHKEQDRNGQRASLGLRLTKKQWSIGPCDNINFSSIFELHLFNMPHLKYEARLANLSDKCGLIGSRKYIAWLQVTMKSLFHFPMCVFCTKYFVRYGDQLRLRAPKNRVGRSNFLFFFIVRPSLVEEKHCHTASENKK